MNSDRPLTIAQAQRVKAAELATQIVSPMAESLSRQTVRPEVQLGENFSQIAEMIYKFMSAE